MSTPSLTLHSWECPASVSLSAPLRPSFRAGSSARGAHTCRVCSVGPVSALRAGRGEPREASSRWLPQHPEGCSEWTSLHNLPQGSPLLQGGDQGPEGPSEGTSGLGNMAKGTVRQRDGHHGQQLCSPSSSGSRPRPSALPGLLTLRPPCRQSPLPPPPAPPSHGHDGTAPAAGGTSRPTCSRPRAWPVAGPREMFAGSRGTSRARKDAPLRAEVPPASL